MKLRKKRIISILIVICVIISIIPQKTVSAAAKDIIYKYSTMLEDQGNIYYIQTSESDNSDALSYSIYRLEVSTGTKTKLISTDNYIISMAIHYGTLYYTSYESENPEYTVYSIAVTGGDIKSICAGYVLYADNNGIYYIINSNSSCKLYRKAYDGSKDTLLYTGNSTFHYVKCIDQTLYFSQYNKSTSKIVLFALQPGALKLTTLAAIKIKLDSYSTSIPTISDAAVVNGDLYYQYGTYEGSGSFWYGTLVKLDADTKKITTITKEMTDSTLYYGENKIYYADIDDSHVYNTVSGKSTTYQCKATDAEYLSILGDITYSAKTVNLKYITVSSFTSGTNKKNLVKDFIKIPYKQKSSLTYAPDVQKLGDYLLISVECIDYNAPGFGWRGEYLEIKWYVADLNGKVLAEF